MKGGCLADHLRSLVTAAFGGKKQNEFIPETADEIAESVLAAYEAGASMVHVHARDPKDLTLCAGEPEPWKEVISKIRKACPDILVNATTGGGPNMTMEQWLPCPSEGNPDLASLNLAPGHEHVPPEGSAAPTALPAARNGHRRVCPQGLMVRFATWRAEMKKRRIKPEAEIYHPRCAWVIRDLIENNLLESPTGSRPSWPSDRKPLTVENTIQFEISPDGSMWLCSAVVSNPSPLWSLLAGGRRASCGLKSHRLLPLGCKAKSNAELVQRQQRTHRASSTAR